MTKSWLGAALAVVALAGCGGRLVVVEGQVLLDGAPCELATVVFLPEEHLLQKDAPQRAQTVTGAEGKFRLNTGNAKGAVPGKYKVIVIKIEYPPEYYQADPTKVGMDKVSELAAQGKQMVAERYRDEKTTPLEIEIPPGGTRDLRIEVNGK